MLRSSRLGFSLIELLVAIVLVDVGLLTIVAGSGFIVRRTTERRIRSAAFATATNRVEELAAAPCRPVSGATNSAWLANEQWGADTVNAGLRDLRDSVTFSLRGERHFVVLRTRLPC